MLLIIFIVEMAPSIGAQSRVLQADAIDFLGDTLTYAISLWAISKALEVRYKLSLVKSVSLIIIVS